MPRQFELAVVAAGAVLVLTAPTLARQPTAAPALALRPEPAPPPAGTTRVPAEVQAGAYAFDPDHSTITWKVSHLGFSTYVGQFSKVGGVLHLDPKTPAASRLNVTVDARSVGTLHTGLDTHLKSPDFLDVARFPAATFNATRIQQTGPKTADVTGDLTLRGVTKPVTVSVQFNQAGVSSVDKRYSIGFDGTAKIKRSDFGITSHLPAVGDEVVLEIESELKRTG